MEKAVIVGIGNIMFCDDGLGVYAAKFLEENFIRPPNVDIVDGGTLGFTLMTYYQEYDYVCILGTTSEGKSGDVFRFGKEELIAQGTTRQSANEVEVAQMLEICSILDEEMALVEIVAMKPQDMMPVVANLTDTVKAAFPNLIEKTLEVLRAHDIDLRPKSETKSLEEIIRAYANPTQEIHIPSSKG